MADLNTNDPYHAKAYLYEAEKHATRLATAEEGLESGYARLGWMILEIAQMQFWRLHHDHFRDYLKSLSMMSRRTPGQLHQYFLTVRDLSDTFSVAELETMGITKALRLRSAKDFALVLPKVIMDAALDPAVTVKELKHLISTTLKLPEEDGDWMDCEMEFMVSPEQRATIEQAIQVAMHTEPLTKQTISKSAQMLDVMTKFAQEFLSAHCGDGL